MATQSVASSTGSNHGTVSPDDTYQTYDTFNIDFDPERDEAICSTIQFKRDFSKTIPELRDTAKKYGRWTPRPQQDIIINTSAIARAFPDFSQAGSPNDTFSLELPRGRKDKQHTTSTGLEFSGDANSPIVNFPNNLRLLHTPKRGDAAIAQAAIFEDATRNNANIRKDTNTSTTHKSPPPTHFAIEQKENIPPIPQQKRNKRSPYTSNASRTISGERKSLKELQAKVADESDGSIIGADRPASVNFQPKNTRFSKATQPSNAPSVPQQPARKPSKQNQHLETHIFTPTGTTPKAPNGTQHSFFVASAFTSAQNTQTSGLPVVQNGKIVKGGRRSFGHVDGMDLPEEEEDIYALARDLKARVAQLQLELAQERSTISQLERDNQSAHKTISQLQQDNHSTTTLSQENAALKHQVAQITGQRDELLLERENNAQIWQQKLAQVTGQRDELLLEREQNTRTWQQKETAVQNKLQRREEAVRNLTATIQQIKETTQKTDIVTTVRASKSASSRGVKDKRQSNTGNHEHDLPSKVMKQAQNHVEEIKAASVNFSDHHHQFIGHNQNHRIPKTRAASALDFNLHQQVFGHNSHQVQNTSTAPNEQHDDTQVTQEASFADNSGDLQNNTQHSNDDGLSDVSTNYSSIVGHGFYPEVRQFLKDARASQKARLEAAEQVSVREDTIQSGRSSHAPSVKMAAEQSARDDTFQTIQSGRSSHAPSVNMTAEQPAVRDDTIQTVQSGRSSHAPSVKGSGGILKNSGAPTQEDFTGRFSTKSVKSNGRTEDQTKRSNTHRRHRSQVEEDLTTKSNTSHRRHHSETTIHSNTRRHTDGDDMTSAYLLADIDAAKQDNGKERPVLSVSARQVLDGLCKHNRKNCTICLRLASFDTNSASKKTIRIQKPIPVSKRAPSPVPYEDEPTLRPAVTPGVALATVLKSLQDEVAHLKIRQSEVQQAYAKHDASLGKRHREAMKLELASLLEKIEIKSDQIYGLYDVVEGQQQSGQEMTQDSMDIDMIDVDEEDLPWEGIEESVY